MELQFEEIHGTPVFAAYNGPPALSRVFGAVANPEKKAWFFPAYPPFGLLVLDDLKKVIKDFTFSPAAKVRADYLASIPDLLTRRALPVESFVTPPFDHQFEGLSFTWLHPRSGLLWDPGTGKSKVIVDLLRALKDQRALILTPKVTVLNWLDQLRIHSGGTIKAAAIVGLPEKKRKIIANSDQYQVLVTSYGTARNMGLPKVLPVALKRLEAAVQGKHLTGSGAQAIGRVIRAVSDPEMQVSFLEDRIAGATLPKVTSDVEAYITAKGPQWLEDVPYQIIVADESHCIKDMRSQQTKAVLALSKKAARRHIMSGTPTLGNPLHLYPQMKFLSPAIIPEDWLRFSDKFLVRAKYNKRIVLGFQNMNILNQRVQRVAINKTKEECLDLPPRSIIDVPVEMSAEQKKLYNTLVSSMAVDLEAFFGDPLKRQMEVANAATLLNKLAQVSSGFMISGGEKQVCNGCPHVTACVPLGVLPGSPGCKVPQPEPTQREVKFTKENPKLEALDELLDTILANPTNKVIVWGVYHAELDAIEQMLAKKLGDKKHWVRVDGRTGTKIQDYINQFNNDPDCRVYVGQIATGVGITLNAASYMIYYALDWSLATYLQSIDRNYRAGQDKKTFVYRLLCRGTVDDYKATALDEKKDISAVLTSKLTCITCQKRTECLLAGIELFDKGCIYQRSTRRTVARPETLQ